MNIMVTGGAGYIGSVLTEELVNSGHNVVVVDNLKRGHREAVTPEASFYPVGVGERLAVESIIKVHSIEAVMHLAAEASVGLSMTDANLFFRNNVADGIALLEAMLNQNVRKLIFASSASIYGEPEEVPIIETARPGPVSSYGESKLIFEQMLEWYTRVHDISAISFRFFNVAGASRRFGQAQFPETMLIPKLINVVTGKEDSLKLFGDDYDTPDGTCIRDYIHVMDIARGLMLGLESLGEDTGHRAYNLGNGQGYSVREVTAAAEKVTGSKIPVEIQPRRPGDPAILVADAGLASAELGWQPQYPEIEAIVESAWLWHQSHPRGYAAPD